MQKILAFGEVLWDLLPSGAKPGGAPVNFAYHAKALGADAAFVSAVGTDPLGNKLLDFFRTIGVSTELVQRLDGVSTGTVGVSLSASGQPKYTIHENVAWDRIDCSEQAIEFLRKSDAFCFGSLASRSPQTRQSLQTLLSQCRPETLRVLDLNLRAPFYNQETIQWLLESANVLKLNDDELVILAEMFECPLRNQQDRANQEDQAKWLIDRYNLQFFILTRGAKGSILLKRLNSTDTVERSDHPGIPLSAAQIVDTVGAGDGFTAKAICDYLAGKPLDQINAAANRYAAYICTQSGATPRIPSEVIC